MRNGRRSFRCGGFTFAELLMAMMVTIIILTAVVTLASAFGNARDATQHMSEDQTYLSTGMIRMLEMIRFSNRVINVESYGPWIDITQPEDEVPSYKRFVHRISLWADSNWNGKIDDPEKWIAIVQIWTDQNENGLEDLAESRSVFQLYDTREVTLLGFNNIVFAVDAAAPNTNLISISFDMENNGQIRNYEVVGSLWASDGHLH